MKQNHMKKSLLITCGTLAVILPLSLGFGVMSKTLRAASVVINDLHFPDGNFRKKVAQFDKNKDGSLSDDEIAEVKTMNVSYCNIALLDGIEYFTALEKLDCSANILSGLNVSKNTKLKELNCLGNWLQSLNVSGCTALEKLDCSSNIMNSLNVSKNTALKELDCSGNNNLKSLNVSGCTALEKLDCSWNNLTSLNMSNNTALTSLDCSYGELTSLEVSKNAALQHLDCRDNKLETLDVSGCALLETLYCQENILTSLIVGKNENLKELWCHTNRFGQLDLSSCKPFLDNLDDKETERVFNERGVYYEYNRSSQTILTLNKGTILKTYQNPTSIAIDETNFPDNTFRNAIVKIEKVPDGFLSKNEISEVKELDLYCSDIYNLKGIEYFTELKTLACIWNNLTSLDVSGCTSLEELSCDLNELTSLDVSGCTALKQLSCSANNIKNLNVSGCTALEYLWCSENPLEDLDVSKNTALNKLYCYDNQLENLDVSKNTALNYLNCYDNQLENLDVSKNTALGTLICSKNQLTNLKLGECLSLNQLQCEDNKIVRLNIGKCPVLLEAFTKGEKEEETDTSITYSFLVTRLMIDKTTEILTSTKLDKPEQVKAIAESASSIKVSWDEVCDAEGYQVWRGTSATGSFTAIGSVTETSRVSTGLTAGTTYYYKVRAYQEVDGKKLYGDYSDVVSAETLVAKPSGVKATATSGTSATVSWNAVAGANGYQVWRGTSSTGTFTAVGSVTTTSRNCTGLTTGTTYYFKVRAYKEVDGKKVYGDYSSVVSVVPKPAAPSNVKAVPETTTGIKISWSAVSGATGYQVWRATSATGTFTAIGSVTETSRVSTGLKAGTTYYYKVRAYKEVNGTKVFGAYSSVVSSMPKPAAPGGVKATVSSATKVTVSWNAVTGATGYEVYRATTANGTYSKLGTVTTTSRACPGLTTGTKYYFKIRAYIEINGVKYYSNYSSVVSATPKS